MQNISGIPSGTAPLPAAAADGTKGIQDQRSAERTQNRPPMDEYIHLKEQEPSGLYWPGKDENGQPKIYFDEPPSSADNPEQPDGVPKTGTPAPEEPEEKSAKEELCAASTDKVDREIEQLKKKQAELEQQISIETNEAKAKDLERQLAQVERELRQKDNSAYRRQHTIFS